MEQILVLVITAFVIYFVVKIGSVIWRAAGLLFILFIFYTYSDQILNYVQSFVANPDFDGLWGTISQAASNVWTTITSFI